MDNLKKLQAASSRYENLFRTHYGTREIFTEFFFIKSSEEGFPPILVFRIYYKKRIEAPKQYRKIEIQNLKGKEKEKGKEKGKEKLPPGLILF